jgi:flagellar motor switch protein FliM
MTQSMPGEEPHDFRRPKRFPGEKIRELALIHEGFARSASLALSRALRSPAQLSLVSVDQLRYDEFINSLPDLVPLCGLSMEGLAGDALLEIDPALAFALVERRAGASSAGQAPCRGLSELEEALLEGLVVRLLCCLREAWAPTLELKPRLSSFESSPCYAGLAEPGEMVALVTLEASVGGSQGMMNLCLPYPSMAPFLSPREEAPAGGQEPLLGPDELGQIRLTRYAIFQAEGEGPTARELAALLSAGDAPAFEAQGRCAYGPSAR